MNKKIDHEFIDSLKEKSDYDLEDLAHKYAYEGDLEKVKYLLSLPNVKKNIDFDNNSSILSSACISGNLNLVKYLLTSPKLKQNFNINADNDLALSDASQAGHLELVKYLIESPELKKHSQIPFINGDNLNPIFLAAENKHLAVIEYLVSIAENKDDYLSRYISKASNEIASMKDLSLVKSYIEIFKNKSDKLMVATLDGLIYGACHKNDTDIIKHIFNSPKLKKHVDIHKNNDELFRHILYCVRMKNSVDVAQYFIFDLNIPETENIKKIRSSRSVDVVENMFQIRNLNETFDKDLSVNQSNNNNNKIKI